MEVDSVHSVSERKVKKKQINVPQHYIDAIKEVRQDNPYEMHYVDY